MLHETAPGEDGSLARRSTQAMSKIDGLLRLAAMQAAEELVLRAGQPPALRVQGTTRKLSMPVMDLDLVRDTLREVVGAHADAPEGEERCTVAGHGMIRVRWRTAATTFEASFGRTSGAAKQAASAPIPMRGEEHAAQAIDAPSPTVASSATDEAHPSRDLVTIVTATERTSRRVDPQSRLGRLLVRALDGGASDLVLADGRSVSAKVNGAMRDLHQPGTAYRETSTGEDDVLAVGEVAAMLLPYVDAPRRATFDHTGSTDLAIELVGEPSTRFRCSLFRALAGTSAVLRPIRSTLPTLQSLRLPPELTRAVDLRDGLVLVTGAAGSGKSTTLVALLEHLNRTEPKHVVTLEDPIEYVFSPDRCVIHQREVGVHVATFAGGLRAALRESPDVILLGEMRDPETIAAAVTAAETGHLVLSTLHSGSAHGAIDRIVDVFPEHQQRQVRGQLADVLRLVVTQRLIPGRDGGRVPAIELLPVNFAVANLIREGKTFQIPQVLQTGRDAGMVPLARAVADLVKSGAVDREVAMRHVPDPQHLLEQLRAR